MTPAPAADGADSASVARGESFLPDFCGLRALFVVVLLAQLLAFVLALVATTEPWRRVEDLALISVLTQWSALACAGVLCAARHALGRLDGRSAGAAAMVLVIATLAVVSELAWWMLAQFDPSRGMVGATRGQFLFRNTAVGALVGAVALRYCYVQYLWQRQIVAESAARLQALQARIRPHFFFNCMNTIASLTRVRPRDAERAVEDLADLFRVSLADARHLVPVEEELALCRKYLDIEHLRLGARLTAVWDVAQVPATARLPVLTLQPLLENAVYHGIEPRTEGGTIEIRARLDAGTLVVEIVNPLPEAGMETHEGNRVAQDNVRQRLAAAFGNDAAFTVERAEHRYCARVRVPTGGSGATS
ncbi:MAG: sensor histidine kinase [Gammaproteobacteria bacterium]